MSYTKVKAFCENRYPGDWWIDSFGVYLIGNVKDANHSFQVFIDRDFNVSIEVFLLYHGCDAWVKISSNEQEIRKDLTRSIPEINEMVDVISEFAEQFSKKNLDEKSTCYS